MQSFVEESKGGERERVTEGESGRQREAEKGRKKDSERDEDDDTLLHKEKKLKCKSASFTNLFLTTHNNHTEQRTWLVSYLVGILSPINHNGLHQG